MRRSNVQLQLGTFWSPLVLRSRGGTWLEAYVHNKTREFGPVIYGYFRHHDAAY